MHSTTEIGVLVVMLQRGLVIGLLVFFALAVMMGVFGGGYYYLIYRNHQADEPAQPPHDER